MNTKSIPLAAACPNLTPPRLAALAKEFGTPFYVYDFDGLETRARWLRSALPRRFELFYAIKANPSLAVLKLFANLGLGADAASAGEVALARAAGFKPKNIMMTGPAKSDNDLHAAVRARIAGINLEGECELDRLQAMATKKKIRIPVQLRLNPPWSLNEKVSIIGGKGGAKFGFELPLANKILACRNRWPRLDFGGFQVFNASNVLDAEKLADNVEKVLALALELALRHDLPLRTLDFGGGFGVPYQANELSLDLMLLGHRLDRIARFADRENRLRKTRLIFEPGRFLTATSGLYVCRVLDVKLAVGIHYARLDGGIHHMLRPALIGASHPVTLLPKDASRRPRRPLRKVTLAGPLCTGTDILAQSIVLPSPRVGDLVAIHNAGAYGYTESMPLFLSHPWPAEIGVRGPNAALIRRPPTVAELRKAQSTPETLIRSWTLPGA